jgi:hypothetical protein
MSRENTEERRIKIPFRLPEFHGDPIKYPEESWAQYQMNMDLAYLVAGIDEKQLTDEQKAAHLLQGLQGKARKVLEYTPGLHKKKLSEIKAALEDRFGRQGYVGLINMNTITQKTDELVIEYLARLRTAAEGLLNSVKNVTVVTEDDLDYLIRTDPHIDRTMIKSEAEHQAELETFERARDALVKVHFVDGLREDIREKVDGKHPQTLAAAVKAAEDYERYMYQHGRYRKGNLAMANAFDHEDIIDNAAKQLQNLNLSPKTGVSDKRRYKENKAEDKPRQTREGAENTANCYFCGKTGHFQRECRQRARIEQNRSPEELRRKEWQRWPANYNNRYPQRQGYQNRYSNWSTSNNRSNNFQTYAPNRNQVNSERYYNRGRPYEYRKPGNSSMQSRVPDMFLRRTERYSVREQQQPGKESLYRQNQQRFTEKNGQGPKNGGAPPQQRGGFRIPPSFQAKNRFQKRE